MATAIEVHPATVERFDDVARVLAPKDPAVAACWCLSYRVPNAELHGLASAERPERLRRYAEEGDPPGVLAYVDGEPAGWCSVGPRSSHHRLTRSRTIPTVDDADPWSVVCIVVRPAFRRQGLARHLLEGAIAFARDRGAPMLEAYPIDPADGRVGATSAFVGTTGLFESVGFERVVETTSRSGGRLRWLMRRSLER